MGADAPQWLFSSFVDAMQEIGASAPIPLLEAEARDLISRWNAKGRILTIPRLSHQNFGAYRRDCLRQHTILKFCGLHCGIKERFLTVVSMFSNAEPTAMNKNSLRCTTHVLAWKHWG